MKLKIIQSDFVMDVASLFSGANVTGTQFLFWLFVRDVKYWRNNRVKLNHERIHFEQGKELLFIGFWFLYGGHYIVNLFRGKFDRKWAYKNIVFEKEAYKKERDLAYLGKRKLFAWIKYL